MFKMLIVGCGGSGGAIVGHLMDHLRADFQRAGIADLPASWQFVHVDMPPIAERAAPGLGTIPEMGGHYVPLAPSVGSYELIDNALSSSADLRSEMATWAARHPAGVRVPIQDGAGQQRAIGRVAVLSKAAGLKAALTGAVNRLNSADATMEANAAYARLPSLGAPSPQLRVFVISSMAGGTGASISLDVTRMLAGITQTPATTALFMCTADVFDDLNPENRTGVRANALAMLGELVACQAGTSGTHDTSMFQMLGVPAATNHSTFRRIIPLSSFRGPGTPIGDRKHGTIYRVAGQALAGLLASDEAFSAFRKRVTENVAPNPFLDKDSYGWGQSDSDVQWGSMGYANLSTGRDRLESYAAQWIARLGTDHLLHGHKTAGANRDDKTQADLLAQSMLGYVCRTVGLPESADNNAVRDWVTATFRSDECQGLAREATATFFGPAMPVPSQGMAGETYGVNLRSYLAQNDAGLIRAGQDAGYAAAYAWSDGFVDRVHAAMADAVARHGMVYTVSLLEALSAHLGFVAQSLVELNQAVQSAAAHYGPQRDNFFATLRGVIQNPAAALDPVRTLYARRTDSLIRGRWCEVVGGVLAQVPAQVLTPLTTSLRETQASVLRVMGEPRRPGGFATVHTERYADWPTAGELVEDRWGASVNEVLLIDYRDFEKETERLLPSAAQLKQEGEPPHLSEARARAVRSVIAGAWPTAQGLEAPGGLLLVDHRPTFAALPRDPDRGEPITPSFGQYRWAVGAAEVLGRATAWVRRPGFAFNKYVTTSIRDLAQVQQEPSVVESFFRTLHLADPMTQVDPVTLSTKHGVHSATVQYAFSEVPLAGIPAGQQLVALAAQRGLEDETVTNLKDALTQHGPSRIDVFGYYPLSMPTAHTGVCVPAADQWAASRNPEARSDFWNLRRSRPLPASLAMSDEERRAMVAGWFVGQLTGHIARPDDIATGPVSVCDPVDGTWTTFPFPYLTSPTEFRMPQDLLPAILESHLIAVANYIGSTPPGRSMAPYRALRHVWDSDPTGPTRAQFGVNTLEADKLLMQWRLTGDVPAGRPATTKKPPVRAADPVARTEAAKDWLRAVRDHVTATVGRDGVPYRTVQNSEQRANAPLLRDLEADLRIMLPAIEALLDVPLPTESGSGADPDY